MWLGVTFFARVETGMPLNLQPSTVTAKVLPNRKTMQVSNGTLHFLAAVLLKGFTLNQDLSRSPGRSQTDKDDPEFLIFCFYPTNA